MEQLGELGLVAGRYRLIEVLGRGGMGTVWQAEDELLGRAVAVKVITAPDNLVSPNSGAGPAPETRAQTAGRARREARAAGRLNHPGAVTVHDIIEEDHRFHIIMELIQAPTLAEMVRAGGPMSPDRVAAIGRQLLDVLEFAHAEGIVHRDIKPSNVMVLAHDRVKLTDFGIALLRGDPQLTTSGATIGSPMFMSPEQAAGTSVGPAADLWSLGATMYYAVEGRPPFDREVAMAVLVAIINQAPDPMRLAGPLEPALTALLSRDPQSRPDGVVLRRLLSLATPGDSPGTPTAAGQTLGTDPEATLDLGATRHDPEPSNPVTTNPTTTANPAIADPATPSPATANPAPDRPAPANSALNSPNPASSNPVGFGTPSYGSPEETRPDSPATIQDRPSDPAVDRTAAQLARSRQGNGKVLKGLVGVLTATVAALSFALLQGDSDKNQSPRTEVPVAQQDAGKAAGNPAGETGAVVAPTALAPLAPDARTEGLTLGSVGRSGLREIEQADVGPRGQSLAKYFDSASNPVGGYAVGVPLSFESVAVGPSTFVEQNDSMFRAGFEVRSYRAVDPWDRLVQDEKEFAKEHAADSYDRKQLTRRWTYRGQAASAWEFTWAVNGDLMHAREVAFRVGPRTYTVLYRSLDVWWLGGGSSAWPDGFERSFFPLP